MQLCHSVTIQEWTRDVAFTASFPFVNHTCLHPLQSIVSFTLSILCFLLHPLLLRHFITFHLLPVKGQIGVSCAEFQHLQFGQVCEGALVHRVRRETVKP